MKRAFLIAFYSSALSCAAFAAPGDDRILHDLSATDLHNIARRLHIRFTERGMGCFDFGSGRRSIFAMLPPGSCLQVPRSYRSADSTLRLSYASPRHHISLAAVNSWNRTFDRQVSTATLNEDAIGLESVLVLERGVTFGTAFDHVQRFLRETEAFEKYLGTRP